VAKPSADHIPLGGFVQTTDQKPHAFSLAKILLAISGSRDAGPVALLPCLYGRVFERRRRTVPASPDASMAGQSRPRDHLLGARAHARTNLGTLTQCNGPVHRPFMRSKISETFDRNGSYRNYFAEFHMKNSADPKETLDSRPSESRSSLSERYAELLELREEVRKVTSSRINLRRRRQA
jgi:hypothetical protein